LYVEDRIKLVITQDSTRVGEIVLSGPENLLSQVLTDVSNGELRLVNNNTCNFVRSFDYELVVKVYVDKLVRLELQSIAEVTVEDTLFVDFLEIRHTALSDIDLMLGGDEVFIRSRNSASTKLRGRIKTLKGSIEEVSSLDAGELICDNVLVDTHTKLETYIRAQKLIYVNIYNSGNVVYVMDEPSEYAIVGINTGSGRLIKK
jgi:hypothetical protein|tara:strand:- start:8257 stop:8865 length:609 start_codon:yes stop_codon:yes gene_type:complete